MGLFNPPLPTCRRALPPGLSLVVFLRCRKLCTVSFESRDISPSSSSVCSLRALVLQVSQHLLPHVLSLVSSEFPVSVWREP